MAALTSDATALTRDAIALISDADTLTSDALILTFQNSPTWRVMASPGEGRAVLELTPFHAIRWKGHQNWRPLGLEDLIQTYQRMKLLCLDSKWFDGLGPWSDLIWRVSALTPCGASCKTLNFSKLQFLCLENGHNNISPGGIFVRHHIEME